ncbi:MAG: hypothetical protein ACKO4Y_03815, partial [Flavobacteriales bacterium]
EFEQIQTDQTELFNAWIESNRTLLSFFQGKELTRFNDSTQLLNHAMLSDFKSYTNHFIPVFEAREDDFWESLSDFMSYFCVIDSNGIKATMPVVSNQVTRQNEEELRLSVSSNDSFNQVLHAFFSAEKIMAYQAFPKEWEVLRIQMFEQSLSLINHANSTSTSAGFILSKLRSIDAPEAVKQSVNEAWEGFQRGQLNIQKKEPKRAKRSRPAVLRILMGAGIVLLGLLLFKWVFSDDDIWSPLPPNSSLVYFTPKERIFIDTTLRSEKPIRSTVSFNTSSGGVNYQIRQAFVNHQAEVLYTTLTKGLNDFYYNPNQLSDTTTSTVLDGTVPLQEFKGVATVKCKNVSAYDVLFIVFDEQVNSPVYTGLIRTGTTQTCKLKKGARIIVLPGKAFSGSNKIPFNIWDFNFDQSLQQVYTFSGGLKLAVVFRGKWGEEFSFTNPYHCFKLNP